MSTPIENNTEELQEILKTVYNLPNLGGKDYDMVFELDGTEVGNGTIASSPIFITCNCDYEAVKAKILNGEAVNAVLKYEYIYGTTATFIGTCTPVMVGYTSKNAYADGTFIYAHFMVHQFPGMHDYPCYALAIRVYDDQSAIGDMTQLAYN